MIKRTISLDFGQILTGKHFSILIIPKKILTDVRFRTIVRGRVHTGLRMVLESKLLHPKTDKSKSNLKIILYYLMLIYLKMLNF